jgi:hypothetical protein
LLNAWSAGGTLNQRKARVAALDKAFVVSSDGDADTFLYSPGIDWKLYS